MLRLTIYVVVFYITLLFPPFFIYFTTSLIYGGNMVVLLTLNRVNFNACTSAPRDFLDFRPFAGE